MVTTWWIAKAGRLINHISLLQLHTSELEDGYNWGRLNLQSVTEQNQLDDFLATAELAGTEFTAEKLNIQVECSEHCLCYRLLTVAYRLFSSVIAILFYMEYHLFYESWKF